LAKRLKEVYDPWFEAAFDQASMGERVRWELGFGIQQLQAGPGQPPQMMPMIMIYAELPAAALGDTHLLFGQLPALGLIEEVVHREVRVLVEKLFEIRSQALAQGNGRRPAIELPK
jgi:hypothetical protein